MGVEIERKFTVKELPSNLEGFAFNEIEQAYLNVHPAIRVRRENDTYYMTYKGGRAADEPFDAANGSIGKVEYNLPLERDSYEHLLSKADGSIIRKKRYFIPLNKDAFTDEYLAENNNIDKAVKDGSIKIELDVFEGAFEGRVLAEVEFPDEASAAAYHMADWFKEDVTGDPAYSNAHMSGEKIS